MRHGGRIFFVQKILSTFYAIARMIDIGLIIRKIKQVMMFHAFTKTTWN